MNDPALDPEEGGGLVVRFEHDRSLRTSDEAAIIDSLSVLLTLLSDNDTAAALIAVGCPPAEAQGLVKQIKHLMRFALCVACVQNGVTDERSALALALRLNKKEYPTHNRDKNAYVEVRKLRDRIVGADHSIDLSGQATVRQHGQTPPRPVRSASAPEVSARSRSLCLETRRRTHGA